MDSYGAECSRPAFEYIFCLFGEPGQKGPAMDPEGHAG